MIYASFVSKFLNYSNIYAILYIYLNKETIIKVYIANILLSACYSIINAFSWLKVSNCPCEKDEKKDSIKSSFFLQTVPFLAYSFYLMNIMFYTIWIRLVQLYVDIFVRVLFSPLSPTSSEGNFKTGGFCFCFF